MKNVYEKLLEVNTLRKGVEEKLTKARALYDDSVALDKALLMDLEDQEERLRTEALLQLEADQLNQIKLDDRLISRQVKRTPKIADTRALYQDFVDHREQLITLKVDMDSVLKSFQEELIIKDKKPVTTALEVYETIEGKFLKGVEVQETKYLTIK